MKRRNSRTSYVDVRTTCQQGLLARSAAQGPGVPRAREQSVLAVESPRPASCTPGPRPPGLVTIPGLLRAVRTVTCTHSAVTQMQTLLVKRLDGGQHGARGA